MFCFFFKAWEEVWQKAGVAAIAEPSYSDINSDSFKLAQKLCVSFYYIYASLPLSLDNQFYGISPAGLIYGGLKRDYDELRFK